MKLRHAKPDDIDFIVKGLRETHIIEKWPEENLVPEEEKNDAVRSINRNEITIIEDGDQKAGFIWLEPDFRAMHLERDDYLWIHLIFVEEEYRRKGVGKLLHDEAERIAKQLGRQYIMLDVFAVNLASSEFYQQLGMEPVYTIFTKPVG